MSFATIYGQFLLLKKRLAVSVGQQALPEITVDAPKTENDELAFIRLVSWAYVLLHESGKVTLNFLKVLPPLNEAGKLLPHVRGLRTWSSHNLSFDKTADLETMKIAIMWFQKTCGTGTPVTPDQWGRCFSQLCSDISYLLEGAITACDILESNEDGGDSIEELKKRLNKSWDAYRFDSYVDKAATTLGFRGINVVDFRNKHLDKWRKLVQLAEDNAVDRLLSQRIEADLLEVMGNALSLTSEELLNLFDLSGPNEIAAFMLFLRSQRGKYTGDLSELLLKVKEAEGSA